MKRYVEDVLGDAHRLDAGVENIIWSHCSAKVSQPHETLTCRWHVSLRGDADDIVEKTVGGFTSAYMGIT